MKKKTWFVTLLVAFCGFSLSSCQNDEYEFPGEAPESTLPCNGDPALCGKRFDQVTFAATHNSFNYTYGETNFLFPNQDFPVKRQLEDGIRCLMLDVYEEGDELVLRHGPSLLGMDLGHEALSVVLKDISTFLKENPREVLSIIFETEVAGTRIGEELELAGLSPLVAYHSAGAPWPTLGEMIERNQRLVVFTENEAQGGQPDWFHYAWGQIVDTPYEYSSREGFSCDYNRGEGSNPLYLINHWVSSSVLGVSLGVGNPDSAAVVNSREVLLDRAMKCKAEHGRNPNFLAVDFYNYGSLMEVVNTLNGL